MSDNWREWIGLPHQIGADPRAGKGACCFMTAIAVCEHNKLPRPNPQATWTQAYMDGKLSEIRTTFEALTEPVESPINGAISLIGQSFCLLTFTEGGVLFVDEKRGLRWAHLSRFPSLSWRRFKP